MNRLTGALVAALGALTWLAAHAQDPSGTQRMYEVRGAKVYVETLGHGHSPDGPWILSYKLMADDTAALIERLGLDRVDVVGHSDGANVGLLLARDHPELVARLVISGANLRSGLSAEEVQRRRQWSPEQLAEKLRTVDASLPPSFRTEYAKVSPDGPDHWMKLLAKSYQMWMQPVVIEPADLKKISAPVLVMAGDGSWNPAATTGTGESCDTRVSRATGQQRAHPFAPANPARKHFKTRRRYAYYSSQGSCI